VGSSQYLYNAKMREEIVEQLGVTPTPGGLQKLLEQHETDRLNAYHETMESFEGDLPMGIISPPALKDVFFDPEDDSLGSLYDESIENLEGAGIGRILPTKYNPAAQGVAGISALISKIMMGDSMDKFNELGDPEDINFAPKGMVDGGIVGLKYGGTPPENFWATGGEQYKEAFDPTKPMDSVLIKGPLNEYGYNRDQYGWLNTKPVNTNGRTLFDAYQDENDPSTKTITTGKVTTNVAAGMPHSQHVITHVMQLLKDYSLGTLLEMTEKGSQDQEMIIDAVSKIDGSMDKFNQLDDPEDVNFSPTGMVDGGLADLLNQNDGFGDEESYQRALEEQAMIFAKSSPNKADYEEALDNMAMNIAGGHLLEKSDVIEDLEQAIAERRVIEGTPDGLSFRDRFKEKFGMEGGGIVHLAGGGNARAVSIVPKVSNTTIPMSHWRPSTSTGRISVNIGSQGPAIVKTIDPGSVAGSQSVGEALRRFVKTGLGRGNTSTSTTPKKGSIADRYKWNPSTGSNLSGSDNTAFSAMFNLGGSRGFGKGAGGNYGQGQRMERRERRMMRNMPIEQRLELESRGFGGGAQAAYQRVAENPSAGFIDEPSNYDELAAYYIKHGGFDENAPVVQWGDA